MIREACRRPDTEIPVNIERFRDCAPTPDDLHQVLRKALALIATDYRIYGLEESGEDRSVPWIRLKLATPIENWLPPVMSGEVAPQLWLTAEQVAAMRPKEEAKPLTVPNIVTYVECEVDCVRYYPRDSTGKRIAREVTLTIDCAGDDNTLAELDACIEFGKVLMCKHRQRKPKESEGQG
jgi:aldehyde:ferredoxin oxidoreductase